MPVRLQLEAMAAAGVMTTAGAGVVAVAAGVVAVAAGAAAAGAVVVMDIGAAGVVLVVGIAAAFGRSAQTEPCRLRPGLMTSPHLSTRWTPPWITPCTKKPS